MNNEPSLMRLTILGKTYDVKCPVGEESAYQAAVRHLQSTLDAIAGRSQLANSEAMLLMAALNISNDYLSLEEQQKQHIKTLSAALDDANA